MCIRDRISCESSDELEHIHREIMSLDGVSDTRTHVVLKNVKNIYSAIDVYKRQVMMYDRQADGSGTA